MSENQKENIDEVLDDDIVTLTTADGNEIDFVEIAEIEYKGKLYAILQPVELLEGMEEDEALVFEMIPTDNGDFNYTVILDDDINEGVFAEYEKLFDEAEEE